MSRIGKKPLLTKEGVTLVQEDRAIRISGSKGELIVALPKNIEVSLNENEVVVTRKNNEKQTRSDHGATARLIENAIQGVSEGWNKVLELVGTGYRGRLEGNSLILAIGYSHPVKIDPPQGINFILEENKITVSGADRHLVGQTAANIRKVRRPDSYKGKGVKYQGEKLRLKPGKAAKTAA